MKAVLFDVDGTLVRFDGAGRRALVDAACRVTRLSTERVEKVVERIDFRGNTDALIAEQMARGLGEGSSGFVGTLFETYVEVLQRHVSAAPRTILPGVVETLDLLSSSEERIRIGLLTGNIRAGARIKLDAIGLGHLAECPGGFGDDGRERAEIARVAVGRLEREGVAPSDVFVVGDTEHDVKAARAAGACSVAVATGWTSRGTLENSAPDALLDDLSQPAALLSLVAGGRNSETP